MTWYPLSLKIFLSIDYWNFLSKRIFLVQIHIFLHFFPTYSPFLYEQNSPLYPNWKLIKVFVYYYITKIGRLLMNQDLINIFLYIYFKNVRSRKTYMYNFLLHFFQLTPFFYSSKTHCFTRIGN